MKKNIILLFVGVISYANSNGQTLFVPSGTPTGISSSSVPNSVGIGTSSPASTLQIKNPSGQSTLKLTSGNTNGSFIGLERMGSSGNFYGFEAGAGNNDDFRLHVNGNWSTPLMIFNSGGNMGIGTSSPNQKLTLVGSQSISGNLYIGTDGTISTIGGPAFSGAIQIKTNSALGGYLNRYLRLGIIDNNAVFHSAIAINDDYNVGIGTTMPDAKLTVLGTIHANEVKVDLSVPGPDYVFETSYNLPSLEELDEYIKANRHLPEVPSACVMEENGVNLGEMNMVLLKKVEELTLYIIELKKEIETIKNDYKK